MVEECQLSRFVVHDRRVIAVETSKGMIECDYVVNTGGMWARKLGLMSEPRVKVPVHPAEHYFLYTQPLEGIDPMMPGRDVLNVFILTTVCFFVLTVYIVLTILNAVLIIFIYSLTVLYAVLIIYTLL